MVSKYIIFLSVTILLGAILIYNLYTKSSIPTPSLKSHYDYIIVGGGTAGCVLGSLLSDRENLNILLIEAGGEFNFLSRIPSTPTAIQRGINDWSFVSTPQKYSSFGLKNKQQFIPRGKGLGGSGQMNYLLHGIGSPEDYESWPKIGAKKWSYADLKPYFDKIFVHSKTKLEILNDMKRPIIRITSIDNVLRKITEVYSEAAEQLFKLNFIVKPFLNTVFNGIRESTYEKYLLPIVQRKNLHVLTNTLVTKINFEQKKAQSVNAFISGGKKLVISATKEIILSSGSIKTPHLLLLSGIGPELELKNHNINLISKSESVGKNLHDHLNMPLYISITKPISVTLGKIFSLKSILNYLIHGKGFIASSGIAAVGIGPKNTSLTLFALGSADEDILRGIANTNPHTFHSFFPLHQNKSQEGFIFLASCLQPLSRGTISLQNINPHEEPIIDPNYLSAQSDVKCTINAIRLALKVLNTKPFKNIGAIVHWPMLNDCKDLWTRQIPDDYLECIIRNGALTGHHFSGTCSMAGDSPVVDECLRVNGVSGLRVVDASVIPTPISSSTNSLVVAIAERAAEMILNDNTQ